MTGSYALPWQQMGQFLNQTVGQIPGSVPAAVGPTAYPPDVMPVVQEAIKHITTPADFLEATKLAGAEMISPNARAQAFSRDLPIGPVAQAYGALGRSIAGAGESIAGGIKDRRAEALMAKRQQVAEKKRLEEEAKLERAQQNKLKALNSAMQAGKIDDPMIGAAIESGDADLAWDLYKDRNKPARQSAAKYNDLYLEDGPQGPGNYKVQMNEDGVGYQVVGPSKRDAKGVKADEAAQQRKAAAERTADIVVTDVDRALALIDNAEFPTTGIIGYLTSGVPETPAHDLSNLIDTIKANVSFDKLQKMRENSPTGGALGQVSDFENKLLQGTLGALSQSQTKEQLKYNLKRVRDTYLDIVHGPGNRPNGAEAADPGGGGPQPGSVEDGYQFKGGDPADQSNWVKVQ